MQLSVGWLIWAALKPIIKLAILLLIGAYCSRIKLITPMVSKTLTKFLLLFPYPCLFFTSIVTSIKAEAIGKMGVLVLFSVIFLALGHLLGYLLAHLLKPKETFKNTLIMSCSMGNYGDLPMAVVLSIGNSEPFKDGDSSQGIAYISAFLLLTNLYFFIVGLASIGQDIQVLIQEEKDREVMELNSINCNAIPPSSATGNNVRSLYQRPQHINSESVQGSDTINSVIVVQDEPATTADEDLRLSSKSLLSKPHLKQKTVSWWTPSLLDFESIRLYLKTPAAQLWIQCVLSPCNIAIVAGLVVTLTPSLKALFIKSPPAYTIQDQPPLSFLMESMVLVASCSVVLGIVNLGAALGSLEVKQFIGWRIAGSIAFTRLLLIPVIGIAMTLLVSATTTWIPDSDPMLRFVIMLEAVVPTASSTVYFTQYWHPKGEAQEISGVILVQYLICGLTLTLSLISILSLL